MTNRLNFQKRIGYYVLSLAMLLIIASCSANNDKYINDLEVQNQILQTQNALLQTSVAGSVESTNEDLVSATPTTMPTIEVIPTSESLPKGQIAAGEPIVYDGWSMIVSSELNINNWDDIWGILVYVKNQGETSRVFRFTNASLTARDDLGNVYEPSTLCPYVGCNSCEEYYHQVKNVNIDSGTSIEISSGTTGNACMDDNGLGMFKGPIPVEASKLFITFEDFGPFTGFDIVIDL
ncbi:MAG: hypothetical protein VB013_14635 [Anaerolineaceae bacterium]|nr:hypothetical protein [Anaerolineaceae bacterium]